MTAVSLGDLAQSFMLRQRNSALRQDINRLTTELATGQVADVRQVLAGNYSYLTDLERKTDILAGYKVATTEASHFASTMQSSLKHFDELAQDLSGSLISAGISATGGGGTDTANEARNALNAMVGALNTAVAGRYLFSGNATNQPPLVESEELLIALKTAVSGASTPADIMAAATTWFESPTGYAAIAYLGSDEPISPFALSQTEDVTIDLRATDPGLSKMLRMAAVAALADDPSFGLDMAEKSELFAATGQEMLATQNSVIASRANVGFVEARIENITSRNAAEFTSLSYAKDALLEVDPFETATELEEVQFQLQSLYSVTVRMSQLSLVNFL